MMRALRRLSFAPVLVALGACAETEHRSAPPAARPLPNAAPSAAADEAGAIGTPALEVSETHSEDGTGTMHYADCLTLRASSKGAAPRVVCTAPDVEEKGSEMVPHVITQLHPEGTDPGTFVLLGWSSWGSGMSTVHAWIVRVEGLAAPTIVDKLAWTARRGAGGLVIDSTHGGRIGVARTFNDLHIVDDWKLEIASRARFLSLEEVAKLPFRPLASPRQGFDAPFDRPSWPTGTAVAWFAVTASGFRMP